MPAATLGLDFGISNSAMAFVRADGLARAVALEGDEPMLPTAVFFNAEERSIHFGREAIALDLAGGSLALRPFQQLLRSAFPKSGLVVGDLFGGVAAGLAYAGSVR